MECRRGEGGGLKEWGMKADFLLAVLARRCISCPTTAEWDGWLIWTINIAVSNWCHITLLLSPEERGSNQAVWVWSHSPEPGTCGDRKRGSKFVRVPIQLFGKTLQRSMDVATSLGKSVTLACSQPRPPEPNHSQSIACEMFKLAEFGSQRNGCRFFFFSPARYKWWIKLVLNPSSLFESDLWLSLI